MSDAAAAVLRRVPLTPTRPMARQIPSYLPALRPRYSRPLRVATGWPGGGAGAGRRSRETPLVANVYGPVYADQSRRNSRVDGDVSATNELKAARKQSQTNLPPREIDGDRESRATSHAARRGGDGAGDGAATDRDAGMSRGRFWSPSADM